MAIGSVCARDPVRINASRNSFHEAMKTRMKVAARPGFDTIPAVRDGCLREIKSALILQPGPAALTDGLDALESIVAEWANRPSARVA